MKFTTYAFAVLLSFTAGTLTSNKAVSSPNSDATVARANTAPFRDGLYMGKIAAAEGKQPRISSGRWNTEADRRAFAAGYGQGFGQ